MDYASGQAFAEEWIDNLSLGGAFVRTPKPLPMFTSLRLDIHLPGRVLPPVPAKVVRVLPQGMGVQFELDARTRDALEEALEKLAARPRRALVALSSEALRSWAKEALLGRGFEVRTVPDAARALGVLLEDAPWLDVLVIEASMHPASGRSLVRMVREEGGEQDLTLVALAAPGEAERWVAAGLGQGLDVVAEQGVAPELFSSRIEDAIAKRQLGPIAQPLVLNAPASEATERLVLRYETAEALRAAAEVLRMGGAFVFTPAPPAQGTTVQLAIELPGGAVLLTEAEVVSEEAAGVGVAFRLEGPSRAALEAALAEVGVEPEPSASKATPSSTDAGGRAGTPGMGSAREVSAPDASRVGSERVPPPVPLASMPPAFQTLLEEEPSNIYGPRVGPFTLLSMLGRGGVAEVHFARALSGPLMGQHVALKRLLAHAARDARFVELFAGEADVTRMLEHPNLVKTLAVGIDGELPWMAMEVVDGCDLGQLLGHARRAGALLPVSYVVGVVHSLLGALDYVHGASGLTGEPLHLVHSDISPANVFVTRDGVVKLGDFGVARARGVELDVAGKAHYLSPDAISGRLEPGVDLWATAVLLYELLTLQRPFDGPDPDAVLTAVRKRRYVRARKLRPDLPADLDRLLERAFSPRARKHFQSAREMAEALSSWIGTPESMQRTLAEHTRKLLAQARTVA